MKRFKKLIKFLLICSLLAVINYLSAMDQAQPPRLGKFARNVVNKVSSATMATKFYANKIATSTKSKISSVASLSTKKVKNSVRTSRDFILDLKYKIGHCASSAKGELGSVLCSLNEKKVAIAKSLLHVFKSGTYTGYRILTNKVFIVSAMLSTVIYLIYMHPYRASLILGSLVAVRILVFNIVAFLKDLKKRVYHSFYNTKKRLYEKLAIPSVLFLSCMAVISAAKINGYI